MRELYHNTKKSRLPWFLFYTGLTIELLIVIVDKSNYINPIEGQLFRVTFLLFALKLLLTDYSKREWCIIVLLEAVAFVSYRVTGVNDLIRLVTFVAACKNIPLKQMLKYAFYVTLIGCMAIVILAVTGIYGDISLTTTFGHAGSEVLDDARYYRTEPVLETRYTLGMGHPNALACMFFILVVLGVYVWFDRMKWYIYLFLMLLNVGVYALTDTKTGLLITTAFLTGACLLTYCKILREKKLIYICGLLVFALCLVFSLDAAVCAQRVREMQWSDYFMGGHNDNRHIEVLSRIDGMITGRIISLTDTARNDGMIETWSVFSCRENTDHYFDMGWVKLFYRYGIVPGIIYITFCLAFWWKLFKQKDACGLLVFTVLTIYTVIEAHLISVYLGRNFMLMMMGHYLMSENRIQNHTAKRCYRLNFPPKNGILN